MPILALQIKIVKSRSPEKRKVLIKVGSGASVASTTIGTDSVKSSFGHVFGLRNCLLLPNRLKNIVFIPLLVKEGY